MPIGEDGEEDRIALAALDIEWVEPKVCADDHANRSELRRGGWKWKVVPPDPDSDMPSGLIEVNDGERQQASKHVLYQDILVKPSDAWSEYVDVREIPMDAQGVPFWIHRRAEQWEEWNRSVGKESVSGGKTVQKPHKGKEPYLPVRCRKIKRDGNRCWGWAADEAANGFCRAHAPGAALAANAGHNIALARLRIVQAGPAMADALEDLALNAASEPVRLKAITEMLDRGGVSVTTDIRLSGQVEVGPDPSILIRERLASLAERLALRAAEAQTEEPVDAEVVSVEADAEATG